MSSLSTSKNQLLSESFSLNVLTNSTEFVPETEFVNKTYVSKTLPVGKASPVGNNLLVSKALPTGDAVDVDKGDVRPNAHITCSFDSDINYTMTHSSKMSRHYSLYSLLLLHNLY